jgi:hypothetical protein
MPWELIPEIIEVIPFSPLSVDLPLIAYIVRSPKNLNKNLLFLLGISRATIRRDTGPSHSILGPYPKTSLDFKLEIF